MYTKFWTGDKNLTYHLCFHSTVELGKACHFFAPNSTIKSYQQRYSNLYDYYFSYKNTFETSNTQTIND